MNKLKRTIVLGEHSKLGQQLMRAVRIIGVGIAVDIATGRAVDATVVVALVEVAWRQAFPVVPTKTPPSP